MEIVKPKKVVAFYRLSRINNELLKKYTHHQRKKIMEELREEAFAVQQDEVRRTVKEINGELIAEYQTITGRNKMTRSLKFEEAVNRAIDEKADLMVSTFDRIGEEIYFTFEIKERLRRVGLRLLFADYLEADDLIVAVKIVISKKERELSCKRQQAKADLVKRYGSKSGKPHGNPHFKNGKYKKEYDEYRRSGSRARRAYAVMNKVNQVNVSYIVEAKKAGNSYQNITDKLNAMGRLTINGNRFTKHNVEWMYRKYLVHYLNGFQIPA